MPILGGGGGGGVSEVGSIHGVVVTKAKNAFGNFVATTERVDQIVDTPGNDRRLGVGERSIVVGMRTGSARGNRNRKMEIILSKIWHPKIAKKLWNVV